MEDKSNDLLAPGRLLDLLKSLKPSLESVLTKYQQSNATDYDALGEIKSKLEKAFFLLYRVQAVEEEVNELNGLIRFASSSIATLSSSGLVSEDGSLLQNEILQSFHYLLVLAQLTLVCALQQNSELQLREGGNKASVGNRIAQSAGSRAGLDSETWSCFGAKAFSCLVYAVFRQPEVDRDRADPADVEWFLQEASLLRGYSYIRLVMLPVLQAVASHDRFTALYLFSVLAELLESVARIFCLPCYESTDPEASGDFPYVFLPPTAAFYNENMAYYASIRENGQHGNCGKAGQVTGEEVDTVEDMILTYAQVMQSHPRLSTTFWPSNAVESIMDRDQVHPFVDKLLSMASHHLHLLLPAFQFLTALASSMEVQGISGARRVYSLLLQTSGVQPILTWQGIIETLDRVIRVLDSSSINTATASASSVPSSSLALPSTISPDTTMGGALGVQQSSSSSLALSALDLEVTRLLLLLLAAVCQDEEVAEAFATSTAQNSFSVVSAVSSLLLSRLTQILRLPLPVECKAAALDILSSIAQHGNLAPLVWEVIENTRLLSSLTVGPFGAASSANRGMALVTGIKAELEEVEARSGQYFFTPSFLQLLCNLLQHGVPENLGQGVRVPGLTVYLTFLVDDVLLKAQDRLYQPRSHLASSQGQKWRILALSLQALALVLRQYQVSDEDFRTDVVDYKVEGQAVSSPSVVSAPRVKSAGYFVLTRLLQAPSSLLQLVLALMRLLSGEGGEAIQKQSQHYLSGVLGQTVVFLRDYFSLANGVGGYGGERPGSGVYRAHRLLARTSLLFEEVHTKLCDVEAAPLAGCDPVIWMEQTLGSVLFLLHEASQRSSAVVSRYQQQHLQSNALTTAASLRGLGVMMPTAILTELGDLLLGYDMVKPLVLCLGLVPSSQPGDRPIASLALALLQYLAVHMAGRDVTEMIIAREVPSAVLNYIVYLLGEDESLVEGFSSLAAEESGEIDWETGLYAVVSLRGPIRPVRVQQSGRSAAWNSATVRGELLTMLLSTFLPQKMCLSLHLLGVSAGRDVRATTTTQDGKTTSDNPLNTLLALLSPDRAPLALLESQPQQAVDIFELLYRLVSHPLSQEVVLQLLRSKSIAFYATQFKYLLSLMHCSSEEIERRRLDRVEESEDSNASLLAPIEEVCGALQVCMAFFLRIAVIEVHQGFYTAEASVSAQRSAQSLLTLLFGPCQALDFPRERCDDMLTITKALAYAHNSLTVSHQSSVEDTLPTWLRSLFASARVSQCGTKAGTAFQTFPNSANPFPVLAPGPVLVDVSRLLQLAASTIAPQEVPDEKEMQEIVQRAVSLNVQTHLRASAAHLLIAWGQLVQIVSSLPPCLKCVEEGARQRGEGLRAVALELVALPALHLIGSGGNVSSISGDYAVEQQLAGILSMVQVACSHSGGGDALTEEELLAMIAVVEGALSCWLPSANNALLPLTTFSSSVPKGGLSKPSQGLLSNILVFLLTSLRPALLVKGESKAQNDSIKRLLEKYGLELLDRLIGLVDLQNPSTFTVWQRSALAGIVALLPFLRACPRLGPSLAPVLQKSGNLERLVRHLPHTLSADLDLYVDGCEAISSLVQWDGLKDYLLHSLHLLPSLCAVALPHLGGGGVGTAEEKQERAVSVTCASLWQVVVASPLAKTNVPYVSAFLHSNKAQLMQLLRKGLPELGGAPQAVLSLLVAAIKTLRPTATNAQTLEPAERELLNELLDFLPDILLRLRSLGLETLPSALIQHFRLYTLHASSTSSYWADLFNGMKDHRAQREAVTVSPPTEAWRDMPLSWTKTEQVAVQAHCQILLLLSSFLRQLCLIQRQVAVDFELLGRVFLTSFEISQAASVDLASKENSMRSFLHNQYNMISTNLLHALQAALTESVVDRQPALVQEVLQVAADAPQQSSLSLLARKMRETLLVWVQEGALKTSHDLSIMM
eukprot:gene6244-6885_t